jgi:hypothetical protein
MLLFANGNQQNIKTNDIKINKKIESMCIARGHATKQQENNQNENFAFPLSFPNFAHPISISLFPRIFLFDEISC